MRQVVYGNTYHNHNLSYSSKSDMGFYVNILDAIEERLYYMISRHCKVFFIRFTLKYPTDSYSSYDENNALLSRFMEALIRNCSRKGLDPHYLWVRERSTTGQAHYHCILLLNGNLIQNAHGVLNKATELWARCLGVENGAGLVHSHFSSDVTGHSFNREPYRGKQIRRSDPDFEAVYNKCFEIASYLAKCYSKDGMPPYVNVFGCSRIPK